MHKKRLRMVAWLISPMFETACRLVVFNPTYAGCCLHLDQPNLPLFRMLEVVDLRHGLDQIAVVGTGFIERAGGRMQQLVGELHG